MRLYLDTASPLLATLLRNAGHDVKLPSDGGLSGAPDPVHLGHAILDGRICVTKNRDDFWLLHNLIKQANGIHAGLFAIRQDNDPRRDLTAKGIVSAIRKLEAASVPIQNEFIVLNHWR